LRGQTVRRLGKGLRFNDTGCVGGKRLIEAMRTLSRVSLRCGRLLDAPARVSRSSVGNDRLDADPLHPMSPRPLDQLFVAVSRVVDLELLGASVDCDSRVYCALPVSIPPQQVAPDARASVARRWGAGGRRSRSWKSPRTTTAGL
jgi:hypothetical protein